MTIKRTQKKEDQKKPVDSGKNLLFLVIGIFALIYLVQWAALTLEKPPIEMSYKDFYDAIKSNNTSERILTATKIEDRIKGKLADGNSYSVNVPISDPKLLDLLRNNVRSFDIKPQKTFLTNIISLFGRQPAPPEAAGACFRLENPGRVLRQTST